MLELREFVTPQEGRENILGENELTAQGVARTIGALDQSAGNGEGDQTRPGVPRRRPQFAGDDPGNNPLPQPRSPVPGAATNPQAPPLQGPPPTGGFRPRRPVGGAVNP